MYADDGIVLLLCIMNLAPRRWIVAVILGLLAGCSDSPKNTFEGYKARAERGDPVAQFNLGVCYDNGEGVAKDQVEAVKWFRKAADQGLAVAQFNLGVCYLYGHGVVKDLNVAYAYWSVAGITNENVRNNLARIERQMSAGQIADGKKRAAELQKQIDTRIAAKKPRK